MKINFEYSPEVHSCVHKYLLGHLNKLHMMDWPGSHNQLLQKPQHMSCHQLLVLASCTHPSRPGKRNCVYIRQSCVCVPTCVGIICLHCAKHMRYFGLHSYIISILRKQKKEPTQTFFPTLFQKTDHIVFNDWRLSIPLFPIAGSLVFHNHILEDNHFSLEGTSKLI